MGAIVVDEFAIFFIPIVRGLREKACIAFERQLLLISVVKNRAFDRPNFCLEEGDQLLTSHTMNQREARS